MTKKNILVVDDEKDIVEFMKDLLEDNGYGVETACDGVQALEQIKKKRPDLILLDLEMPNETGTGLYRKLRGKSEFKEIPVIVVSGLAGRNIAVSKSVTVIDKPPEESQILEEVGKFLDSN